MPRIRCSYEDCVFINKLFCTSASIELDPEDGCLTYSEDPLVMNMAEFDEEEVYSDSWEDEGFQELDNSSLDDDEKY